ncbi:MAG: ion channel [Proteobacteria bacterium]|nr:ion channel [Pseudomonadota bacterium]
MGKRKDQAIVVRFGAAQVYRIGASRTILDDPYHFILTLSWPRFYALVIAFYLAINLVFATAYWLVEGCIANTRPGSFADVFFFSIETLATVGYGAMYPATLYGHTIAAIEILLGLMSLAIVTGLIFSRFSKPTARILFSRRMVIRPFEGARVLMLRAANERNNRIVEANASLAMVRTERTIDGETFTRIHDLPLLRDHTPAFALTWTLIHRIDESSPLHGWTQESLLEARTRIMISINGHDETMAAAVHSYHDYLSEDLMFDSRFVDVMVKGENDERIIDMTRFHDIEPMR